MKRVSAQYLSYYILSYVPSNQLKIQKLVYYCDAWHLVYFEQPLIEEDFEAWVHGPAIRSLWDLYKNKGNYFTKLHLNGENSDKIRTYFTRVLQKEQLELMSDVLKEYGDKSSYYLETLTHNERPWIEARRGYSQSERSEVIIPKETMKEFYRTLLIEK
ncbi:MAG: DUF4065 domain-containing protein [Treponema sp.]|jgi:uncharacterized phage-associated protein|nr:DUF4065 domain-containing protein [Treponema sp.]